MSEPYHDYIDIDTQAIEDGGYYEQPIKLRDGNYYFTFKYNDIDKTFTVDISDNDGPIYYGEPLVLGQPLWRLINNPRLPSESLIPLSNNFDTQITLDNLNKSVFLCVDNLDEGES